MRLLSSDPRARCVVIGHRSRLATHYTITGGHFCKECAERIKKQPAYGGPHTIREFEYDRERTYPLDALNL